MILAFTKFMLGSTQSDIKRAVLTRTKRVLTPDYGLKALNYVFKLIEILNLLPRVALVRGGSPLQASKFYTLILSFSASFAKI